MRRFAHVERQGICDLALAVGPEAPTLCEGWTVIDLISHLVIRERDPIGAAGIFLPVFSHSTRKRQEQLMARHDFADLVEMVRSGPQRLNPLSRSGVDEMINAMEFFIHHEDIRRASSHTVIPRPLQRSYDDQLWRKTVFIARQRLKKARIGVMFDRLVNGASVEHIIVATGPHPLTVRGEASEVAMWIYGRGSHARIDFEGDDEAHERLSTLDLSI